MIYEINNCQAGSMCFAEEKNRVYAASSNAKELIFPECNITSKFSYSRHATMNLSKDGRFLTLYSPGGYLEIYNTDNIDQPIYKTRWKDVATSCTYCCYRGDSELLVAVQNALYSINLYQTDKCSIIYGDAQPILSNWKQYGHICSLSTCEDEIALLHYCFEPYKTYILYSKGATISFDEKQELPSSFHYPYTHLALKPGGGICLFSDKKDYPMLYYESFPKNISVPDRIVSLPSMTGPCFSHNGKYLTFIVSETNCLRSSCWLVETENWSVVRKIEDRKVYNPSFSNHDSYWLLPGPNPLIVKLD